MASHTPGPYRTDGHAIYADAAENGIVAHLTPQMSGKRFNAELLASAPELKRDLTTAECALVLIAETAQFHADRAKTHEQREIWDRVRQYAVSGISRAAIRAARG